MDDLIDELYGGFVAALPLEVQAVARDLPHVLGLAPVTGTSWSKVFNHQVTLAAPSLVAEAFPRLTPELIRNATLAHALSVIEAFGFDRVAKVFSYEVYAVLIPDSRCVSKEGFNFQKEKQVRDGGPSFLRSDYSS